MAHPYQAPYQPPMQYMPPPPPYGYPQPEYLNAGPPPTWHDQPPLGYTNQAPYAYPIPQPPFPPGPPPPMNQPHPPPMLISGNTITNLTTNQPIYTITTNSLKTKITLLHTATSTPVGQGERHTFSSNTITISGRTSKLKTSESSLSDRWAYVPTWEQNGVKWYFKNRKKLDFRLMDQKSDGQAILTSVDNQIRFERFLTPEQVGELLLALAVLREQVRGDKGAGEEGGEEVGEEVLASVLLS